MNKQLHHCHPNLFQKEEKSMQITCPSSCEMLLSITESMNSLSMEDTKKSLVAFKCTLCEQEFKSDNGLKRHMSKMHPEIQNMSVFECSYCTKCFSSKGNLTRHMKSKH